MKNTLILSLLFWALVHLFQTKAEIPAEYWSLSGTMCFKILLSSFLNCYNFEVSNYSEDSHIILDCGEGTYGQIVRNFGAEEADRILASTKVIYISHLHADHHIGSITLLQRRREAVKKLNAECKKVYFLAPEQILYWFYSYHFHFESILDCFELISNQDLVCLIGQKNNNDHVLVLSHLQFFCHFSYPKKRKFPN